MKVLHLLFSRGWGGLERYAIDTARAMADRGHDVRFLRRRGTPAAAELARLGFPGEEWSPVKYIDLPAILALRRLVKQMGVEIVHAHHSADLGLAAPALFKTPRVKLVFSNYMKIPRPKTDLYHRLEYGRVDHALVGSLGMRQNSIDNLPVSPERVIHIPYGLPLGRFDPGRVKGVLRERFGVGRDRPLIGVISRLDPHKGQMEMIEAMPRVLSRFPGAVLALTGDETPEFEGRYRSGLEDKVAELELGGSVIFTGATDDTPSYLADLDVYVLATHSESFSLGCLEAMAMRRPVVGTDSGGTPDMLDHGRCGLLARPKDPAALAGAVMRLLEDEGLREELAGAAREKVVRLYDREKSMDMIAAIYRQGGGATSA